MARPAGGEGDESENGATVSPAEEDAKSSRSRRVARRYTPSEKAEILEYAGEHGVSVAAKKFGASRYSIYEWKRKVERAAAGKGPSPTSGPSPNEVEALRDKEILNEWHRHPGLGPSQIRNQLRRRGVKVAVQTVRRVMEDARLRELGELQRAAQWRLDFVTSENSMGFHAPQEMARILAESIDLSRQAQVQALATLDGGAASLVSEGEPEAEGEPESEVADADVGDAGASSPDAEIRNHIGDAVVGTDGDRNLAPEKTVGH